MKFNLRFIMICFGMLLICPAASLNATETKTDKLEATGVPSLLCAEPNFSFPEVVEGTEVRHIFYLSNKGTAPLAIQKVRTG